MSRAWSPLAALRRALRRDAVERDLDDEVAGYFEILVERGMARGLTRQEAEREARLRWDGPEAVKQRVRQSWAGAALETTMQDVSYALRALRKSPGFTFFAVLSIALGLGANVAIFTLLDAVALKSSGYPDPDRLVRIWEQPPGEGRNVVGAGAMVEWTTQSRSFEGIAARRPDAMNFTRGDETRSLRVAFVSVPYFDVFGEKAALGRTFVEADGRLGHEKVVVLGHSLWLDAFAGDPGVIGHTVTLNGEAYAVVGVMPAHVASSRRQAQAFLPLVFRPPLTRDYRDLVAFGRLKPGVSVAQAQAELSAIAGAAEAGWGALVDPFESRSDRNERPLIVLMLTVLSVLLIACANLANLLMARGTLRSREMGLRAAVGASRARLLRMLLTESLVLSLVGAVAGAAIGYGLLQWIQGFLPPFSFAPEVNIAMDARVFLFLAGATLATAVAFGLTPALQLARETAGSALKEGARSSSAGRGHSRARDAFVAAQVAAAMILLVLAGSFLHSLRRLLATDIGYDVAGLVSAELPFDKSRDPDPADLTRYYQRLVDEIRATPGMRDAAVTTALPLQGWGDCMPFHRPDGRYESCTGFKIVTSSYFSTLGLRATVGRLLDERDAAGAPRVLVVNQSFVKRYLSDAARVVGERIRVQPMWPSRRGLDPETSWEIVGVVPDEKGEGLMSLGNDCGVYASLQQSPVVGVGVVARGRDEDRVVIRDLERAIRRVNRNQALDRPTTIAQIKVQSTAVYRLYVQLLTGFGLLAMVLACSGLYALLSFSTAARTRELGIRAALGATRGGLVAMVVAGAAKPIVVGLLLGLGGAIAVCRFVASILYETGAVDPPILVVAIVLFVSVALIGCMVPAWRAGNADPMAALRSD